MSYRQSKNSAFGSMSANFNKRTTSTMSQLLLHLADEHQKRITNYQLYWDFYNGDHWGEATFNDKSVTLNYARTIVDVKAAFLSKNGFDIKIPEDPNDDGDSALEVRNFVKMALDDQWDRNRRKVWFEKVAQIASITGDAFFRLSLDQSDQIEGDYIRVDSLAPNFVFPEYNDITGELEEVLIAFPFTTKKFQFDGFINRKLEEKEVTELYKEIWTKETVTIMHGEEVVEEKENMFGLIPIVHVQNFPNSDGHFGISDLRDLIPIQRNLNEKATDISDIIDYHGSPVTVLFGARVENLERGPDKIWQLPKKGDADIKNLELIGDLKANLDYFNILRNTLLDVARVPEQAINPTKNVSNTPGVALHMTYLPLIDDRRIKENQFSLGLQQVNKIMLFMLEKIDAAFSEEFSKLSKKTRYRTEVTFGEALPRDEILKLENNRSRLQMGITTRKRILMEDGAGEKDADRIITEADVELRHMAEITALNNELKSPDAFGKTRRPDPVIQGDRISTQAANAAMTLADDAY